MQSGGRGRENSVRSGSMCAKQDAELQLSGTLRNLPWFYELEQRSPECTFLR